VGQYRHFALSFEAGLFATADTRKFRGYFRFRFDPVDVGQYAAARDCPALRQKTDDPTAETFVKLRGALIIAQRVSNKGKGKLVGWRGIIVGFAPGEAI
jgi:hypothetical protein